MLLALATVFSLYPLPLQLPVDDGAKVQVVRSDPAYRADVVAQAAFARLVPPAPGCYQLAYTPPAPEAPTQWCSVERPQIAPPSLPVMAVGGSYQIQLYNLPSVRYRWSVSPPSSNQEIAAGGGHIVELSPAVAGEHRLHLTAIDTRLPEATTTVTYPLTVEPSLPRFVIVDLKPVSDDRGGYLLRALRSNTLLTTPLTLQIDGDDPSPWLLGHDRYAPATARLATVRIGDTGEIIATRRLEPFDSRVAPPQIELETYPDQWIALSAPDGYSLSLLSGQLIADAREIRTSRYWYVRREMTQAYEFTATSTAGSVRRTVSAARDVLEQIPIRISEQRLPAAPAVVSVEADLMGIAPGDVGSMRWSVNGDVVLGANKFVTIFLPEPGDYDIAFELVTMSGRRHAGKTVVTIRENEPPSCSFSRSLAPQALVASCVDPDGVVSSISWRSEDTDIELGSGPRLIATAHAVRVVATDDRDRSSLYRVEVTDEGVVQVSPAETPEDR